MYKVYWKRHKPNSRWQLFGETEKLEAVKDWIEMFRKNYLDVGECKIIFPEKGKETK